jgi:N-acetyl-anhydromuramyl-L-alanine amidase AmpD
MFETALLAICGLGGCSPRASQVAPAPAFASTAALTKPPLAERLANPTKFAQVSTIVDRGSPVSPADLKPDAPVRKWNYIVLHHTGTPTGDVASIESDHRQRTDSAGQPWLGIGYHFVIGNGQGMADGMVEPTFRWRQQLHGAHAGDRQYNQEGIGICLVGDFNDSPPTPRQIDSLKRLVDMLVGQYSIDRESVVRHSDVAATECPGSRFPWDVLFARESGTLVP